jgi:hypothetical protein
VAPRAEGVLWINAINKREKIMCLRQPGFLFIPSISHLHKN